SSFPIGCRPASERSMMASRRWPRAQVPSDHSPEASGPRWRMASSAGPTGPPAPPSYLTSPKIPHIGSPRALSSPSYALPFPRAAPPPRPDALIEPAVSDPADLLEVEAVARGGQATVREAVLPAQALDGLERLAVRIPVEPADQDAHPVPLDHRVQVADARGA